jgi:bifunctional non-homologous end joining protein LigD
MRPTLLRPVGFIEPCLPSVAAKPPSGPGWLHEIKHDGYRLMAKRAGKRVRLFTRNGNDWSELFPAVVATVERLDINSCLIDGEIVVCDEKCLAVFDLLRQGARIKHDAHLYAFDLLELDGRALTRVPIEERKYQLARLLNGAPVGVQLCSHLEGPGDIVFEHACKLGCEGIVSKRLGSTYRPGPRKCSDWIKVKNPAAPAVRREAEEDWGKRVIRFKRPDGLINIPSPCAPTKLDETHPKDRECAGVRYKVPSQPDRS